MSARRILVTGGSGFIGSALVKALLRAGETVRVFDDNSRGALRRLREVERDIEFVSGDIRDAAAVDAAMRGIDEVHHLAFVNGTATFYSAPDLVLDVGVKGIVNVIDACRRHGVGTPDAGVELGGLPVAAAACRPTSACRSSFPIRSIRASPTAPARSSAR